MMKSKKEQIIEAAIELFAEHGFAATTTCDIATAAGVAQGTLFYHFGSKEGILHAVLTEVLGHVIEIYNDNNYIIGNGYDCLERLLRREMEVVQQHSRKVLVLIRDMAAEIHQPGGRSHELISAFFRRKLVVLETVLRRGMADGSIRQLPVSETAWFLDATMYGIMHSRMLKQELIATRDDIAIDLCLAAVAAHNNAILEE